VTTNPRFILVNPGELRLPPPRRSGADPFKLAQQMRQFGDSTEGMPPLELTRGDRGELMINDGVTRASRIAKLRPGVIIPAEVIEDCPGVSFHHLPRVKETL